MTWSEVVENTIKQINNSVEDDSDELEKHIAAAYSKVFREVADTLSLARIATALEKLAGLPYDGVDEVEYSFAEAEEND